MLAINHLIACCWYGVAALTENMPTWLQQVNRGVAPSTFDAWSANLPSFKMFQEDMNLLLLLCNMQRGTHMRIHSCVPFCKTFSLSLSLSLPFSLLDNDKSY